MSKVFISQLEIPGRTVREKRLWTAYALHQHLWQGFPGCPEARRDFLFRATHTHSGIGVMMYSAKKPAAPPGSVLHGVKELDAYLPAGALYQFRLLANPTVRSHKSRALQAVTGDEELTQWLVRKGSRHGFQLRSEPEFSESRLEKFSRKDGASPISMRVVDISGVLSVADSELFAGALANGIGRGRAFGCGMLLLKRIAL